MLTAAHFCRIAGEKQTKQLERKEKKRIARRQRSSKAEIEVTRLTPTPIVGFKKFFLSFAFFFYILFVSYLGRRNLVIKAFFFFSAALAEASASGRQKSFGDKQALMTDCVFIVHISLLAHIFPFSCMKGSNRKL